MRRAAAGLVALGAGAMGALPAQAHVKWFAPYLVDAAPQPISATLTNQWFWTGIGLVLAFFLAALAIERMALGRAIQVASTGSAPLSGAARTTSCARPSGASSSPSSPSAGSISPRISRRIRS